jgi:hypothetical protein
MRTLKVKQGPFQERPYSARNEIDRICLCATAASLLLLEGEFFDVVLVSVH